MPEARRPSVCDAEDLEKKITKKRIQQTSVFEPIVDLCERQRSLHLYIFFFLVREAKALQNCGASKALSASSKAALTKGLASLAECLRYRKDLMLSS
jgi:hypothetical protein